jgi:hypothetical protein
MKIGNIIKSLFSVAALGSLFLQCPPTLPDDIPPVVNIIQPVSGQVVSGTTLVTVGASDETELKEVVLFIDGVIVLTGKGALLQYSWDTAPIADNQEHNLYATATDGRNNGFSGSVIVRVVSSSNPDSLPPVISILHPTTGSTVSDTVNVVPQIEDASPIDRVEYFVDGIVEATITQAPYEYLWPVTPFINGTVHTIFAKAYDINQNSSVSNIVSVTVQNIDIVPPSVLITFPTAGSVFTAGDTVEIVADAQDNIGIQRVEFSIDGQLKITDTSRPYSYIWDTTGFGAGQHTIYVKAYDLAQNSNAQLISVTINP